MKSSFSYCIDVGGTFLKGAILDRNGELQTEVFQVRVHPTLSFDDSFKEFKELLGILKKEKTRLNLDVSFLALSFPGPFDYKNGISLMKHKFTSLYEVNLREHLSKELDEEMPIYFENDVISFLYGAAGDKENIAAITLGTGLGYCIKSTHIERNDLGSPKEVLWNVPYRYGTMEDYFSSRGMIKFYRETANKEILSSKEIYDLANKGDKDAITAIGEFGKEFGKVLNERLQGRVNDLYLGGQVSKSFEFLKESMQKELPNISLHNASDENTALKGLALRFFNGEEE